MTTSSVVYGLLFLWIGAVAFGSLVMLRDRWRSAAAHGGALPAPSVRKGVEAACLFAGSVGMVTGLGILGVSVLR